MRLALLDTHLDNGRLVSYTSVPSSAILNRRNSSKRIATLENSRNGEPQIFINIICASQIILLSPRPTRLTSNFDCFEVRIYDDAYRAKCQKLDSRLRHRHSDTIGFALHFSYKCFHNLQTS